ncbi:uncharacterized protein J4E88_007410 [Alternaria novae-zelandiae]|uniref:uncharacterized protein n=1 Tax=Alternaria novae-zelandiae TaxID=430562 RepID=UPI0020C28FEA|nr:uncharacterized protein J4E88_007410 [Alternaria novae-zelandiae]KAI4676492.1 hypothetical protein J4E88_007410 [Alternaria novae-zelandiae]
MNFWEQMLLVFGLLYGVLSNVTVAHDICDILFRGILHIDFFELQLHKHPSEDSIAELKPNFRRMALLCGAFTFIYFFFLAPRHPGMNRRFDLTLGTSIVLKAIHSLESKMIYCFNKIDLGLKSLESNVTKEKKFSKRLSKKADLSDARKLASNMPRKHLHVITRNSFSRRLRKVENRLDQEQLEQVQLAFKNNKLSPSVTALDNVITSLFTDLAAPSTHITHHANNIDKLKHVHSSVRRASRKKDTRIGALEDENNDMFEELRHKDAELDTALTNAADLTDDCQRSKVLLQKVTANKLKIEESLRRCKIELRRADVNHTTSSGRVARLEDQIQLMRQSTQEANERADAIEEELQDVKGQMSGLERERADLETERHQLQMKLNTAKEQLNGEDGLEKKTHDLDAAHELARQLKDEISALKERHADVVSNKEKDLRELKQLNRDAISRKSKEMQEHRRKYQVALSTKEKKDEGLRNDLAATINAKDAELERLRAEHAVAITAKDRQLEAKHQSEAAIITRHGIETQKLREEVDSVKLQKDNKVKELDALVSSHDDAMRELRQQLDLVTRQKNAKAQELEDSRTKHIADVADKEKEFDDIVSRHESQIQELRKELDLARDQKADEAEKLEISQAELATAINLKNAELQEAHYELAIAISGKESEIGTLNTKHVAAISGKESEIGSLHTEHAATIARKDAELKKAHDDYAIAISGKESEIGSIHTEHATAISGKESEIGSLHTQHTAVIARKDEELEALRKDLDMAKLNKQPSSTDGLKVLVDSQQETILSMTNEWNAVYGIIENVNMCLPSVLKRLGKPLNDRLPEIRARMRRDSEFRPAEHLGDLETAMKIRRGRYELEGTFDHQWEFLKKFVPALVEAHPDVKELAKAIDDTFDRLEEQVVQPTKAPTIAPAPAKATPEKPPKDTCACKYRFLVTDSQDACRDHLDGCDDFAKWTPEKKKSLLGKLDLTGYQQPKQTKPKAESITCWHCEREFDKAHGQWFHGSHVKVCKRGAPSFDDVPGSSTPGPKTPVTTPSRRAPVIEHGWQNTGSAKKAETSDFVSSGMGSSKYARR